MDLLRFLFFFILTILHVVIHAQAQYEPVYVSVYPKEYMGIISMTYEGNQFIFNVHPTTPIGVACPHPNDPSNALFITREVPHQLAIGLECDEPVKAQGFMGYDGRSYSIGFPIYKTDIDPNLAALYPSVPHGQYHFWYLVVKFDSATSHVWSVYHHILQGKFLDYDLPYNQQLTPYAKNVDLYGYDIDDLYKENHQTQQLINNGYSGHDQLVKMQLAPEEDFFLINYKNGTRANINTTAVWQMLTTQWYLLENFVRRVAEVTLHYDHLLDDYYYYTTFYKNLQRFDELVIVTGTANGSQREAPPLMYLHPQNKFPVSKYIYKTVEYERYLSGTLHQVGIIFIMHNDPFTANQQPLCNDVSEDWGWLFLGNYQASSLIYGCPLTINNYARVAISSQRDHEDFNLHQVPFTVPRADGVGDTTQMRNIFDEIMHNG